MNERIEVFKQMIAAEANNGSAMFGLANEYVKANEFELAIPVLEDYLALGTDEGAAYGMLARCYLETSETEKAFAAYEKGIEVSLRNGHPSMAETYKFAIENEI
ncbi:MAG: tetratricopeptide repeat protein [Pyrinomonadaceae bacterium]